MVRSCFESWVFWILSSSHQNGLPNLSVRYIKSICYSLKLQLRFIKCNLTVHQYFICKELLLMRYPGTFFGRLQCAGWGRFEDFFSLQHFGGQIAESLISGGNRWVSRCAAGLFRVLSWRRHIPGGQTKVTAPVLQVPVRTEESNRMNTHTCMSCTKN